MVKPTRKSRLYRMSQGFIYVLIGLSYLYFTERQPNALTFVTHYQTYYASQAEGYLRGHLYMTLNASSKLLALSNPYSPYLRRSVPFLWDASFFKGKYYLYFSSLPILLLYIPIKLVCGAYPSDASVCLVFAYLSFLFGARLLNLMNTKEDGRQRVSPHAALLVLGLANLLPYLLNRCFCYEVAITCALAATTAFLGEFYTIFVLQRSTKIHYAALILAFSCMVASRPNLVLVAPVLALAASMHFKEIPQSLKKFALAGLPIGIVSGATLLILNYQRFGSPLEFGMKYQLTSVDPRVFHLPFRISRLQHGMISYLAKLPYLSPRFPFLSLTTEPLLPQDFSLFLPPEFVAGLFVLFPYLCLGLCFALRFLFISKIKLQTGRAVRERRFGFIILTAALIELGFIANNPLLTVRYEIDFWPFLLGGCAIFSLLYCDLLGKTLQGRLATVVLVLTSSYAVFVGFCLGFKSA